MSEYIEKARPDVGASERETEQRNTCKAFSVSMENFNTRGKGKQSFVDYLPHDPANAITAEKLGKMLSMSQREVTSAIQACRLHGIPICASCGTPYGYFITDEPVILARYIKSLKGRVNEMSATLKSLTDVLDAMTGQQQIDSF